jgi:hypothetical protein
MKLIPGEIMEKPGFQGIEPARPEHVIFLKFRGPCLRRYFNTERNDT